MPYVAAGTYGCVFKPHLKCANATHKSKDSVGKVFASDSSFQEEYDIMQKIQKIDPHNEFTLPIFFTCPIAHKHRKSDQVEKCHLTHSADHELNMQLIMQNGGKSLGPSITKGISHQMFFKLFTAFTSLIKGAHLLESFQPGYIHQDIKPENIMYRRGKLYLIDFGIFTTFRDFMRSKSQMNMMQADYPFFPVEYKLLMNTDKKTGIKKAVSEVLGNINIPLKIREGYTTVETILKYFHPETYQHIGDMYETLHRQIAKTDQVAKYFTNKINIYQLGLVLAMLFFAASLDKYSVRRLSAKSQRVQYIKSVIAECIHPNAYLRKTPQEILNMLSY